MNPERTGMRDAVVAAMRAAFGEEWGTDIESNLRFSVDVEAVLQGLEDLHLIGDPEMEDDEVVVRVWVDKPVPDLLTADALAYAVFGRISEEVFYAERQFESGGLRYPFVTGSARRGHIGSLHLAGPHASDFAERFRKRVTGGARFHA